MDDDAQLIDWYDIVEAVANGRTSGHRCPACTDGELVAQQQGASVRIRCQACGMGFEGRLAHGRDDALLAEAIAMEERARKAPAAAATGSPARTPAASTPAVAPQTAPPQAAPTPAAPDPARTRPEPWTWELPAGEGDLDGFSMWIGVVESIHNGRRTGLACPFCSEPLTDITAQPPHIRVRCLVCGEAFEGRIG